MGWMDTALDASWALGFMVLDAERHVGWWTTDALFRSRCRARSRRVSEGPSLSLRVGPSILTARGCSDGLRSGLEAIGAWASPAGAAPSLGSSGWVGLPWLLALSRLSGIFTFRKFGRDFLS